MTNTSFASKYKVIEKIGEGSFSEVLKCQNRATGEMIAAKRLKKIYRNRQDVNNCPEVVATRKLTQHPNILCVLETIYEPLLSRVTLIFELLDMSMYDFMKTRRRCVPESRVKNYLYQLLHGVCHLHKCGLFHRDIKPENILIKLINYDPLHEFEGEIIKLGDLGSIRGIYSKPPYTEYISTRWYRSPECLLTNGFYGPKMDIWAVGCVFYEMLTLRPLFPGSDEIDQIYKIHLILGTPSSRLVGKFQRHKSRNCTYSFPKITGTGFNKLIPTLSPDGVDVLKQMLTYDPDFRPNVRRLLEHRYFKDFRTTDEYLRRTMSMPQNECIINSNKSIGDYSKTKSINVSDKTIYAKNTKTISKNVVPPMYSEIITSLAKDPKNPLKSKSGSINLERMLKKSINKSDTTKNSLSSTKKQPQTNVNKLWDAHFAAKLTLLKESEKLNQTLRTQRDCLEKQKQQTTNSTLKKPHELSTYFSLFNEIKKPQKKTSDPGQLNTSSKIPFIGNQFLSKSFVLPRKMDGDVKLSTIVEHQPQTDTTSNSKSTTIRQSGPMFGLQNKTLAGKLVVRPQCRKSTRVAVKSTH